MIENYGSCVMEKNTDLSVEGKENKLEWSYEQKGSLRPAEVRWR